MDQGNRMIDLAASILSANFACLGAEVQAAVEGGATVLHLDIMDGQSHDRASGCRRSPQGVAGFPRLSPDDQTPRRIYPGIG